MFLFVEKWCWERFSSMLGIFPTIYQFHFPYHTDKCISQYSQLSPCGHPAIMDTRYQGQNPDSSESYRSRFDWKWLLLVRTLAIMELDTFAVQKEQYFIVLTLVKADTMTFSYDINTKKLYSVDCAIVFTSIFRVVTFSFTMWLRFHMAFHMAFHIIIVFTSIFTGWLPSPLPCE